MSIWTIAIIILLLLALFGLPTWPYAANWGYGYYPSGGFGLLALILILILVFSPGRL
jgi:hypothetical protein